MRHQGAVGGAIVLAFLGGCSNYALRDPVADAGQDDAAPDVGGITVTDSGASDAPLDQTTVDAAADVAFDGRPDTDAVADGHVADAGADVPLTCATGTWLCGGNCVGPNVDMCGPTCAKCTMASGGSNAGRVLSCSSAGLCEAKCASPLTECASDGCVDTSTSKAHCGGCGKTCGASCINGACVGPVLVKQLNSARDVYVTGEAVYWSRDNEIERCALPCGASGSILPAGYAPTNGNFVSVASSPTDTFFAGVSYQGQGGYMAKYAILSSAPINIGPSPIAIAADASDVFFSADTSLYRMPIGGTSATKLMDTPVPAQGVALTPTALFWHPASAGGVFGCARSSCSGATQIVGPQAVRSVAALFSTGTAIYFADNYGVTDPLGGADIYTCPASVGACTPTLIASREPAISAIVVSNGYIYWSSAGSSVSATGTVRGCRLGQCAPKTLASNLPRPVALSAAAPTDVYIAANGLEGGWYSGGVYRISKEQ